MSGRVLHVSQPVEAGVARVVLDLLRDQSAAGWRVSLLSPQGWLSDQAQQDGVPWSRWEAVRQPGPSVLGETRRIARLVAEHAPDLVHLHSSKAGLAGRLAIRGRRATVFQPHAWSFAAATGPQARAAVAWERAGSRWTGLQLCCSPEEADEGRRYGISGEQAVVPNGVDLRRFTVASAAGRAAARNRLGLEPAVPVAVCVGRLSRQKGQDVAVAAWPAVRSVLPGAVLLLVGDGPDRAALEAAAGPGVRLLGGRDDVPAVLAAADVCVLPSRWEGLALALLEAMACGRSVVATDVAGSRSTLVDGDAPAGGAVVPVDVVPELAVALVERLGDRARAAAEGAAGRARAERAHDVRLTTRQVRDRYRDLLAAPVSRRGG